MSAPAIYFVGDDALAIPVPGRAERHALAASLRASGMWIDVVPGKGEVTVQFDPLRLPPAEALELLAVQAAKAELEGESAPRTLTLRMKTDEASAPDLARIAAENGLAPEAFLARIFASPLVVDMMGFTAGFAYVAGVDASLTAPRLDTPRQKVPAGSVGVLTGQLGFYALAGPAGWPIIGQVTTQLFDAAREAPFTLDAGMQIILAQEA